MESVDLGGSVAESPTTVQAEAQVKRRSRDFVLRRLLAGADVVAILTSLVFALLLGGAHIGGRLVWGLAAVPLFLLLFKLYGLYDRDAKRIGYSTVDDLPWLFHATVIGGLILWVYARSTPMGRLGLIQILSFGVGMLVLVMAARFTVRRTAGLIVSAERALLIGSGVTARTFVRKLAAHPEYQIDMVGALWLGDGAGDGISVDLPLLGDIDQLDEVAATHNVDRVVFCGPDVNDPEVERLLRRCRAQSLKVSVLPRLSDVLGSAVTIDDVEGITVLGLNPPWLSRSSRAVKRALDLMLATVLLTVLSPVLIVLAVVIKLDSRGPVLFNQERVGKGGRRFRVHKLRTMTADAEARRAELLGESTDPNWLKLERDPRITRVGRWLRRLSLDEIPQLYNVLRGEMSMVGPRPLIPAEDELVLGWLRGRLDLTPGLTGYWQVLGRTRIPFEEMVKLDYLYVVNWSLWEDIRLMLRTLPVVLSGRGVN